MGSSFEIEFSDEARRDFRKIDKKDCQKILKKLLDLGDYERNNNVRRLRGELGEYFRLRVGKLRVVFQVDEKRRKILVEFVGFRGSIYR